jgi:hypothetical protein
MRLVCFVESLASLIATAPTHHLHLRHAFPRDLLAVDRAISATHGCVVITVADGESRSSN